MFEYKKVEYEEIQSYRKRYLEELSELQELYVEWLVEKGSYYTVSNSGEIIGYFIISPQNSLVELYVNSSDTVEIFNSRVKPDRF